MTATAVDHGPAESGGHAEHKSHDRTYVITAIGLAIITFAETATYLWPKVPVWDWGDGVGITVSLLVMMAVKFFFVGAVFMHLKFDNKLLATTFVAGIVLAIGVYLAVLFAFRFFSAGTHMV